MRNGENPNNARPISRIIGRSGASARSAQPHSRKLAVVSSTIISAGSHQDRGAARATSTCTSAEPGMR